MLKENEGQEQNCVGLTVQPEAVHERLVTRVGYDKLWLWFGCSRASWLTMPRVLMHEMPDEWQSKMADLLEEWDDAFDSSELPSPHVSAKNGNKFTKWPEWLTNYRRPNLIEVEKLKTNRSA